ncbi:hypothetical protein JCM10450v2_004430 [Rhodotorula kratochvilovae]
MAEYIELSAHYNGVYVFLSYLVSFVGAWTTLEMLLKRTGSTGLWNVMLLFGAGIAFGSTATFGMHFVGNQAVTLRFPPPWEGTGAPLSYNAGFTILSLVVSCISMIIAFSFIGLRFNAPRWRSRLTDEERGSSASSEKSAIAAPEDDDELAVSEGADRKSPTMATGAAFDPDLKVDTSVDPSQQQTRFHLPTGRKHSIAPAAFSVTLPKRGAEKGTSSFADEKRTQRRDDDDDEEDEHSSDGGDFGVGAAKVSLWGVTKILLAGIVCGGGIAAMHYIGQVSINSVPRVTNNWYTVFLSVIIAMFCVTVGLYILFVIFRPKLQHSWYKRIIVAGILAIGVCLMHFVALLGTHYWAIQGEDLRTGSDKSTKAVIIAIICVVAPVCCILLLIFAYLGQQRALHQKMSRHRIILSTAIFDQQGLLLVHPDSGLLPSAQIYPSRQNEPEKSSIWQVIGSGNRLHLDASKLKLQRSDPAFVAFLKMSWNWRTQKAPDGAAPGVIGEDAHLAFGGPGTASRAGDDQEVGTTTRLSEADEEMTGTEAELLRRSIISFEMAGEEISSELTGSPNLKALGVLYDSILKIGHFQVSSKSSGDKFTVTQGQMLVLARRLKNNAEREALVARGYVFAEPSAVARVTSSAYAVPNDRVFEYFRNVYRFTRFGIAKRLDRGRLYGGLLMLQALPGEGLHVIVDDKQHHSLPMTDLASLVDPRQDRARYAASSLPVTTLDSVVDALEQLSGQTLLDLINTSNTSYVVDTASELRSLIVKTLRPYLERVLTPDTLDFLLSRLHIAPTVIPLTARHGPTYGSEGLLKDSYLVCLKAVIPSSVTLPGPRLDWLPFPLYQAQAECVTRASGAAATGPRPQTGGSVVEAARFGSHRSETSGGGGPGRKGSLADWSDSGDHPMFATSTAAPFSSGPSTSHPLSQRSAGPSGQRGSTYSSSSAADDDDEGDIAAASGAGSLSPRPAMSTGASDLPDGVPEYSPDWIVGLIRTAVAPGHHAHHWEVPPPARKGASAPRRST